MRTLRSLVPLALGLLLLPSTASAGPSPVVYPEPSLPLHFSHRKHLAMKLACDFCHAAAPTSLSSKDNLLPTEEVCRTCHKIDRAQPLKDAFPPARCDACHARGVDERAVIPEPNLRFNHRVHVSRGARCEDCHGDLRQLDLATRAQLPRMELCLGCHTQATARTPQGAGRAPARCTTCHPARSDGTLEQDFASGRLVPSSGALLGDTHGPRFSVEHGRLAAHAESYCGSCHRRDYCLSCHDGVVKPMSLHANDYLSIHAVDARKESTTCDSCHRRQTFCLGCHERSGLVDGRTLASPSDVALGARRFHPPYERWVQGPRTPEHHSWQAERNLKQCVSCHREDTCLECHSARRAQGEIFHVSPHPPGFAQSRSCAALSSRNARVCIKCHTPSDPHLLCR